MPKCFLTKTFNCLSLYTGMPQHTLRLYCTAHTSYVPNPTIYRVLIYILKNPIFFLLFSIECPYSSTLYYECSTENEARQDLIYESPLPQSYGHLCMQWHERHTKSGHRNANLVDKSFTAYISDISVLLWWWYTVYSIINIFFYLMSHSRATPRIVQCLQKEKSVRFCVMIF